MWTPADRVLVGDFGSGQALSDDQYRLLAAFIPPAKPGGRPRTTDMRRLLDGLFYVVRTGCQWRHLPPPPAFPPWPTVYGYFRAFLPTTSVVVPHPGQRGVPSAGLLIRWTPVAGVAPLTRDNHTLSRLLARRSRGFWTGSSTYRAPRPGGRAGSRPARARPAGRCHNPPRAWFVPPGGAGASPRHVPLDRGRVAPPVSCTAGQLRSRGHVAIRNAACPCKRQHGE